MFNIGKRQEFYTQSLSLTSETSGADSSEVGVNQRRKNKEEKFGKGKSGRKIAFFPDIFLPLSLTPF